MRTLRARLFAATLGTLALTTGLTLAVGLVLTHRQVDRAQSAALARRADDLAAQRRARPSYIRQDTDTGSVRILIAPRSQLAVYVPRTASSSDGTTAVDGRRELYSYRPLPHLGLLLLRPASAGAAAWRPFLRDLLFSALAGVAVAAALSFLVARSIARPVRRIAGATRALADGRHEPLPPRGGEELASLANAVNELADELAASRDAERTFLLSVSHELKTPLTAIRGYAEGLADGAVEPEEAGAVIGRESQRLERLVQDILDLARMNRSTFAVRREPVDLAAVGREAVERHDANARRFGVDLRAETDETWVQADHDRVLQIASNLVENALRATPAGGHVVVTVAAGTLTVADSGPGIAEADLPRAFERFYLYDRADRSRTVGTGLGLAIVQQLTQALGGEVTVDSTPGAGSRFAVRLPRTAPPVGPVEAQPATVATT